MAPFFRSASCIAIAVTIAWFATLMPARGAAPADERKIEDRKIEDLKTRAQQGYIEAEIELAAAYLLGRGVPADATQAAHWYLRAAQSGSPEAQNEIGYLYQTGVGVPVDGERAAHWFQLASSGGMSRAKINLGVSYLYGTGVRKNPDMARRLFQEAEEKGSGLGATYLGLMAYFGLGGPVDKNAAEHWFETGTRLHDPEAAYDLALLFEAPDGKHHDVTKAAELLRFSAEKGYVAAKHGLGLLLVQHPELAQSQNEAWRQLSEASLAGSWKATVLAGVLARDGKMTARDARQAYYDFCLAALQGGAEARQLVAPDLDALNQKLPPAERSAAAGQAKAWFDQHPTPLLYTVRDNDKEKYFPLLAAAEPSAATPDR